MKFEKSSTHTLTDYSLNRVEGMILGLGESKEEATKDFLQKAKELKVKSEQNVIILEGIIKEAENLLINSK